MMQQLLSQNQTGFSQLDEIMRGYGISMNNMRDYALGNQVPKSQKKQN